MKSELSLKERLYRYLLKQHGFVASGDLQRIVAERTTYSPQNVGRRLRELVESGDLVVKYIKGHAWYKANETEDLKTEAARKVAFFNAYQPQSLKTSL